MNLGDVIEEADGTLYGDGVNVAARLESVAETDGICVSSCPTSPRFAKGLFIVQDGTNAGGNQNFKLHAWEDIAGTLLLIDTSWQPRGALE